MLKVSDVTEVDEAGQLREFGPSGKVRHLLVGHIGQQLLDVAPGHTVVDENVRVFGKIPACHPVVAYIQGAVQEAMGLDPAAVPIRNEIAVCRTGALRSRYVMPGSEP